MKRLIILIGLIGMLMSCTSTPDKPADKDQVLHGTVLLVQKEYLIKSDEVGLLRIPKEPWELAAGDEILLHFDGAVLESYPVQLGKVTDISVTGKTPDAVGLLVERYHNLSTQDNLGADTDFLYVDLNKLTIFDNHDRFALLEALRAIEKHQVEEATLETLKESGKFDETQLFIKDGTLLTIESADVEEDGFTLMLSIYRSGRGAIGENYAVRIQADRWEFKLLQQWIAKSPVTLSVPL